MSKQSVPPWRALGVSCSVALLLSILGWVSLNQSVLAATDQPVDALAVLTVNTTSPAINDNGLCSIIEAIENANTDTLVHDDCAVGNGNDTISLPSDAVLIFTAAHNNIGGGNALPVITSTITIIGNGATLIRDVNTAPNFRFFNVAAGATLTLNDIGLRNGQAAITGTTQLLLSGGAIVNQGFLNIVNSNLSYNHASFGGAIYSQPITGALSINNSTFSFNSADINGGALYNFGPGAITGSILRYNDAGTSGGGIMQDSSTLTISNTTVLDNMSGGAGAGIAARATLADSELFVLATDVISNAAATNGGGIYNTAHNGLTSLVEVRGSEIAANHADSTVANEGHGGGIVNGWVMGNEGGVAETRVIQSYVVDNVAQTGGGIANVDVTGYPTRTAELIVSQSTLARNTAVGLGTDRGSGGGLYNSNGEATVANSTFSANQALGDDSATGGRGGGIGNVGRGTATTLHLRNSTLAFNQASQAGGGVATISQVTTPPTATDFGNTLIVSNVLTITQSVSNAAVLLAISSPQVFTGTESCSVEDSGTTSLGGNIEDSATCGFTLSTDLQDRSVALGTLADNGGPTLTHLISEAGAAFDGGVDALCSSAPVSGVDQRGVARPQGTKCDVGAVELVPAPPIIYDLYFPEIYRFFTFQQGVSQ